MGRPTNDDSKIFFLSQLAKLNNAIGNGAFIKRLNWKPERYWSIHSELLSEGKIARGRGRGGSVIRVELATPQSNYAKDGRKRPALNTERHHYKPILDVIETSWIRERGYDDWVVELTADKRLKGAGVWTQPDVASIATACYSHLPSRVFEIITFEIKPASFLDVRGVFEALSHNQLATMSYVIFCTDGMTLDLKSNEWKNIRGLAVQFGVGVIIAEDSSNGETWEEIVDAQRKTYSPERANAFIQSSFNEDAKSLILKWQK